MCTSLAFVALIISKYLSNFATGRICTAVPYESAVKMWPPSLSSLAEHPTCTPCTNSANGSAAASSERAHEWQRALSFWGSGCHSGPGRMFDFIPGEKEQIAFNGSSTSNRPPSPFHVTFKRIVDVFMEFYYTACYAARTTVPGSRGWAGGGG